MGKYSIQENNVTVEEKVKTKILEKYSIPEDKAQEFAEKAIAETWAHGGNPENPQEMDKVIDGVVKSWVQRWRGSK
jgi:hypothetical protein